MKGIFRFGNYGWLGKYRANSILSITNQKLGVREPININPLIPLDIFHACYLLNTKYVDNPNQFLKQITQPILKDEELRNMTIADDLLSRVFAVKFLIKFLEELEKQKYSNKGLRNEIEQVIQNLGGKGRQSPSAFGRNKLNKVITDAAEKAKQDAKNYTKQAKIYGGLKAGVGHDVTFEELLNLDEFTVNIEELLRLFKEIDVAFNQHKYSSQFGIYSGIKFGRDLTKVIPSVMALPEELFWYKYATNTLPILDTTLIKTDKFILVVDKSGSMASKNKTLWSRAVALKLAKMARTERIDAKLIWFDYEPFGLTDLKREFDKALKYILTMRCTGGTSIDKALKEADKFNYTIILITDGEDRVTYEPRNKLISVMIDGDNDTLKKVSSKYLSVTPTVNGAIKLLEEVSIYEEDSLF